MMALSENMSLLHVGALVLSGGVLGGCSDFIRGLIFRGSLHFNDHPIGFWQSALNLLLFGFVGAAGAVALQFVFVLLDSFSDSYNVTRQVFLISVSTAAGFGARRILPKLTDRIEDQIEQIKKDNVQLKSQTLVNLEKIKEIKTGNQENFIFNKVLTILQQKTPEHNDFVWSLKNLKSILDHDKFNRPACILTGRIHRRMGNLNAGIDVLSSVIVRKSQENQYDQDFADILYQRAVYYALLHNDLKDDEKSNSIDRIISDLKKSFDISPDNKEEARHEKDFSDIKSNKDFKEAIK